MKLPAFLYALTLALLAAKALGLLAVSWFLVFLPALLALGLAGVVVAVAILTVVASATTGAPAKAAAKR